MGVGVQVVAQVERLTDFQTGIFCIVGSIAALLAAYIGVLLLPRITASKSNTRELYFETEDMDAFRQHLESFDVCYVHKLHEHAWGQRVIRFYDPDGHIIETAEKLDAVIARFVAQGLSPEETAVRMDIPLDFIVSSLNGSK